MKKAERKKITISRGQRWPMALYKAILSESKKDGLDFNTFVCKEMALVIGIRP
jgi:hypothetical protein